MDPIVFNREFLPPAEPRQDDGPAVAGFFDMLFGGGKLGIDADDEEVLGRRYQDVDSHRPTAFEDSLAARDQLAQRRDDDWESDLTPPQTNERELEERPALATPERGEPEVEPETRQQEVISDDRRPAGDDTSNNEGDNRETLAAHTGTEPATPPQNTAAEGEALNGNSLAAMPAPLSPPAAQTLTGEAKTDRAANIGAIPASPGTNPSGQAVADADPRSALNRAATATSVEGASQLTRFADKDIKATGRQTEPAQMTPTSTSTGPQVKVSLRQASLAGVAAGPLSAANSLTAMQAGETSSSGTTQQITQTAGAAASVAAQANAQAQSKAQGKDKGAGSGGKQAQGPSFAVAVQKTAGAQTAMQSGPSAPEESPGRQAGGTGSSPQNGGMPGQAASLLNRAAGTFQVNAVNTGAAPESGRPQLLPGGPAEQVAVHIQKAAAGGADRINIKLHPAELGRVDVRMETAENGSLRAVITVERPEALEFLQRDARGLERSLQDAGLKTDSQSLAFERHDAHQRGREQAHERGAENANSAPRPADTLGDEEPVPTPVLSNLGAASESGRLDISV